MARDIKLVDGDIPKAAQWVSDDDLVVQKCKIRLNTWLGEWILDRGVGMQYETLFQQKPPNVTDFIATIRLELEEIEEIAAIPILEGSYDPATEAITISGRVQLLDEEAAIEARLEGGSFSLDFIGV